MIRRGRKIARDEKRSRLCLTNGAPPLLCARISCETPVGCIIFGNPSQIRLNYDPHTGAAQISQAFPEEFSWEARVSKVYSSLNVTFSFFINHPIHFRNLKFCNLYFIEESCAYYKNYV